MEPTKHPLREAQNYQNVQLEMSPQDTSSKQKVGTVSLTAISNLQSKDQSLLNSGSISKRQSLTRTKSYNGPMKSCDQKDENSPRNTLRASGKENELVSGILFKEAPNSPTNERAAVRDSLTLRSKSLIHVSKKMDFGFETTKGGESLEPLKKLLSLYRLGRLNYLSQAERTETVKEKLPNINRDSFIRSKIFAYILDDLKIPEIIRCKEILEINVAFLNESKLPSLKKDEVVERPPEFLDLELLCSQVDEPIKDYPLLVEILKEFLNGIKELDNLEMRDDVSLRLLSHPVGHHMLKRWIKESRLIGDAEDRQLADIYFSLHNALQACEQTKNEIQNLERELDKNRQIVKSLEEELEKGHSESDIADEIKRTYTIEALNQSKRNAWSLEWSILKLCESQNEVIRRLQLLFYRPENIKSFQRLERLSGYLHTLPSQRFLDTQKLLPLEFFQNLTELIAQYIDFRYFSIYADHPVLQTEQAQVMRNNLFNLDEFSFEAQKSRRDEKKPSKPSKDLSKSTKRNSVKNLKACLEEDLLPSINGMKINHLEGSILNVLLGTVSESFFWFRQYRDGLKPIDSSEEAYKRSRPRLLHASGITGYLLSAHRTLSGKIGNIKTAGIIDIQLFLSKLAQLGKTTDPAAFCSLWTDCRKIEFQKKLLDALIPLEIIYLIKRLDDNKMDTLGRDVLTFIEQQKKLAFVESQRFPWRQGAEIKSLGDKTIHQIPRTMFPSHKKGGNIFRAVHVFIRGQKGDQHVGMVPFLPKGEFNESMTALLSMIYQSEGGSDLFGKYSVEEAVEIFARNITENNTEITRKYGQDAPVFYLLQSFSIGAFSTVAMRVITESIAPPVSSTKGTYYKAEWDSKFQEVDIILDPENSSWETVYRKKLKVGFATGNTSTNENFVPYACLTINSHTRPTDSIGDKVEGEWSMDAKFAPQTTSDQRDTILKTLTRYEDPEKRGGSENSRKLTRSLSIQKLLGSKPPTHEQKKESKADHPVLKPSPQKGETTEEHFGQLPVYISHKE